MAENFLMFQWKKKKNEKSIEISKNNDYTTDSLLDMKNIT